MNQKALEVERIRVTNRGGQDEAQYIWRFKSGNGQVVSWSGDTYHNLTDCLNGACIGSPVVSIDQEAGTMIYLTTNPLESYDDNSAEGKYTYIDSFEDEHGRPTRTLPPENQVIGAILKGTPFAEALMSRGLRLVGDHVVMDTDSVWHRKHPDENRCVQEDCNMHMLLENGDA